MYQLSAKVHLDQHNECYKKIIIVEPKPTTGALSSIIKVIGRTKLSPFDQPSPCCPQNNCLNVIVDPNNKRQLLCVKDIAVLFSYLLSNGYKIDTQVTKIMLKSDVRIPNLICFVSEN